MVFGTIMMSRYAAGQTASLPASQPASRLSFALSQFTLLPGKRKKLLQFNSTCKLAKKILDIFAFSAGHSRSHASMHATAPYNSVLPSQGINLADINCHLKLARYFFSKKCLPFFIPETSAHFGISGTAGKEEEEEDGP